MPFTVTMPKLSPTMEEGAIAKWHKKVGDHVNAGDVLLEVATDKATVEYNALDEGYLRKILVNDGGRAMVNQADRGLHRKSERKHRGLSARGRAARRRQNRRLRRRLWKNRLQRKRQSERAC